ncbi:hypothetical protein DFH08DRAFT_804141 [Mycena albidolilacea]|uniref:Uncharacterized protein n=1 Tax=Mycena albidolilacea TaxID=1033008 RepID=A0AAD7EWR6_9AGAR|nr:hypothetical protein DFH08DRAFT_804141 [Mycena albidolilacea]
MAFHNAQKLHEAICGLCGFCTTSLWYATLAAKCDHATLTNPILCHSPITAKMPHTLLASSTITANMLHHIFSFCTLSRLVLAAPGGFNLNDTAIDAMAHAWQDMWFLLPPTAWQQGIPVHNFHGPLCTCLPLQLDNASSSGMGFDLSVVPDEEHSQPELVHDQTKSVQNTLSPES